jgi:TfoX/Sxy family transcriptional regulator of competence genes
MPHSEKIAARIREALAGTRGVKEKKMFRGICFMVNGKMCVCVGPDEMMCRIGPDAFEEALEREGCRPMMRHGKAIKGFVFVSDEGMKRKKDFDYWIGLSLAFNKKAKASR